MIKDVTKDIDVRRYIAWKKIVKGKPIYIRLYELIYYELLITWLEMGKPPIRSAINEMINLKEFNEDKELTEDEFNNLKPLLEKENGVWKLKHGGEKISVVLKISKTDSQNLKMMISTTKSKYANWVKDFHTFLMKENIEIFENDLELFKIDIKQISKMYFLKIVCNLLGYISIGAAIVGYFLTWWFWIPCSIIMGIIGFIMTRI